MTEPKNDKQTFLEGLKEFAKDIKDTLKSWQKFVDYKLADGTIIRTDTPTLDKGTKVTTVTDSGEVPIVDGEYEVSVGDATVTITTVGGYVTDVAQGADDANPADANPNAMAAPKVDVGNDAKILMDKIAEHHNRITSLEEAMKKIIPAGTPPAPAPVGCSKAEFAELTNKVTIAEKENNDLKKIITDIFALIEKISEQPSEQPTEKPKNKFNIAVKKYETASMNDIEAKIKKLKQLNNN